MKSLSTETPAKTTAQYVDSSEELSVDYDSFLASDEEQQNFDSEFPLGRDPIKPGKLIQSPRLDDPCAFDVDLSGDGKRVWTSESFLPVQQGLDSIPRSDPAHLDTSISLKTTTDIDEGDRQPPSKPLKPRGKKPSNPKLCESHWLRYLLRHLLAGTGWIMKFGIRKPDAHTLIRLLLGDDISSKIELHPPKEGVGMTSKDEDKMPCAAVLAGCAGV